MTKLIRLGRHPHAVAALLVIVALCLSCCVNASAEETKTLVVDITPGHAINTFDPARSLGAGIDSQNAGAVANIYTPANIRGMLAAGLGPVSYRLYTELSVQDWHWNAHGLWSDPSGRGYWTGGVTSPTFLRDTFGYRLPHRGFTHDQGNDDDYSRLDDGDSTSYWKSNPYLAARFTGESDALHPQWIVIDLGSPRPVNAAQIAWSNPFARTYFVQYWTGSDAINDPAHGHWVTWNGGSVTSGNGGSVRLRLGTRPIRAEFVRILMLSSSNTCDTHGAADVRNCVGYAVNEIGLGRVDAHGAFHDDVVHIADNTQTTTYVSSVDPWHEQRNRVTDQEQAGFDIVYRSGLTRGLPAMVPVGMLYGTPEDSAAEIRYLESHRYGIAYVELGEEPDGQYILPEDYGALYVQWARALHRVDRRLLLGGPVFQGVTQDVPAWADAHGDTSWLHRFLRYLSAHGELSQLGFMSFEHYPFDPCAANVAQNLYDEPKVMRGIVQTWYRDGLPRVPLFITETNYSGPASAVMQDLSGALWLADMEGSFLAAGGAGVFLYQYEPEPLVPEGTDCNTWGAWGMFVANGSNQIRQRTSQFFAAQLLTQYWAEPVDALHTMVPTAFPAENPHGKHPVSAYGLYRPDGTWALLFVNKDPQSAHSVRIVFRDAMARGDRYFSASINATTFTGSQYLWHPDGPNGYASPDGPLSRIVLAGGRSAVYRLPRASIVVLQGMVR